MSGDTPDWVSQEAPVGRIGTGLVALTASEVGLVYALIPAVAGASIVLTELRLSPDWTAGSNGTVRDWVVCHAFTPVTQTELARCAISPAFPSDRAVIAPGAAAAPIGEGISVQVTARAGSGSQLVVVDASYYLV